MCAQQCVTDRHIVSSSHVCTAVCHWPAHCVVITCVPVAALATAGTWHVVTDRLPLLATSLGDRSVATASHISCIIIHFPRRWTVLNRTERYWTVLKGTELYWKVLNCTERYWTVLYCNVLYCTVLHCTVLYWNLMQCTELYWTEL